MFGGEVGDEAYCTCGWLRARGNPPASSGFPAAAVTDRCGRQRQNQAFRADATNTLSMHDTSAPHFAHMLRKLDGILARTIAFVESFAALWVDGSGSRPVAAAAARRGLKVGAGRSGGFAEHCSAPAKPVGYAEPTVGGRRFRLCCPAGRPQAAASWAPALRVPLLRGRARPLAKLADAEKAGIVVGQRQRTAPVTAPRGGVRQIGSGLWPACFTWRVGNGSGRQ